MYIFGYRADEAGFIWTTNNELILKNQHLIIAPVYIFIVIVFVWGSNLLGDSKGKLILSVLASIFSFFGLSAFLYFSENIARHLLMSSILMGIVSWIHFCMLHMHIAFKNEGKKQPSDWRLMGQEIYLKGVKLNFKSYKTQCDEWDHDHCAFCSEKFCLDIKDALKEGYATEDNYHWVCLKCYEDFKRDFEWVVK